MIHGDRYCSGCGSGLEMRQMEGKDRPVCANCGRVVYYDPKVSTVCVVARERGVLFIKRGKRTWVWTVESAGRVRGPW